MAGRYPESKLSKHPAYEEGTAKAQENDEFHAARAAELRPTSLQGEELEIWDRLAPEMSKLGRLKPHHVEAVAEYCIVKVRMNETRRHLEASDWTYMTEGRHGMQIKSRPEAGQYNDDWRKWNSLVAQLGLSPATDLRFNDRQGSLFEDDEYGSL